MEGLNSRWDLGLEHPPVLSAAGLINMEAGRRTSTFWSSSCGRREFGTPLGAHFSRLKSDQCPSGLLWSSHSCFLMSLWCSSLCPFAHRKFLGNLRVLHPKPFLMHSLGECSYLIPEHHPMLPADQRGRWYSHGYDGAGTVEWEPGPCS